MQVTKTNDVKIYNLTSGRSIPDFLSHRKRQKLLKKDGDLRKRIELIQDFSFDDTSWQVKTSPDGQYIFATGTYKPSLKCFDVNQLSMKFARGLDSDVVRFDILSQDYRKLVLMHDDRFVSFHSQAGFYHRFRIPRNGRDMMYCPSTCNLNFCCAGPDIYRYNLELGQFLSPLNSEASGVDSCDINPVHQLLVFGTSDGCVKAWDPRTHNCIGTLDCAASHISSLNNGRLPAVSAVKFRDNVTLGVGLSTGQVMVYDIRANNYTVCKDHNSDLPIKNIVFHNRDLVMSMDNQTLKMWHCSNTKTFTSIQANVGLNDLCAVPDTGLLFMANESEKILTYFLPALGPAPRWCSFLDSITEEMEESVVDIVYDDYKFVSKEELTRLGLDHLIGSKIVTAHMHGYFIDMSHYRKAKTIAEPFDLSKYKEKKVKEMIAAERVNRVKIAMNKPKVNQELAEKLSSTNSKLNRKMLTDKRFEAVFNDPEFQIDPDNMEYKLSNPAAARKQELAEERIKITPAEDVAVERDEVERDSDIDSSSDDDREAAAEIAKTHKAVRNEIRKKEREEQEMQIREATIYELKQEKAKKKSASKLTLEERLQAISTESVTQTTGRMGNQEMVYQIGGHHREKQRLADAKHKGERRKVARSARSILPKPPPPGFRKRRF